MCWTHSGFIFAHEEEDEEDDKEGLKWSLQGAHLHDPQCMEHLSFYLHKCLKDNSLRSFYFGLTDDMVEHLSHKSLYYLTKAAEAGVREARGAFGPKVSLSAQASTAKDSWFLFEDEINEIIYWHKQNPNYLQFYLVDLLKIPNS